MYYSKEYFRALAPRIRMSDEILSLVLDKFDAFSPEEGEEKARFLADSAVLYTDKRRYIEELAAKEDGWILCIVLYMAAAGYTHEAYKKRGLPDEVFYESMNVIPEKLETNYKFFGAWGNVAPHWPLMLINLRIFRIGRLQYEPTFTYPAGGAHGFDKFREEHTPFIGVHIPDNDKLVGCAESFDKARDFFKTYFPEHNFTVFTTTTWLLDPNLKDLLPETSNILKFQSLFDIFERYDDINEILNRTFGFVSENLADYKPYSSLGKTILKAIEDGKHLGRGAGYIPF